MQGLTDADAPGPDQSADRHDALGREAVQTIGRGAGHLSLCSVGLDDHEITNVFVLHELCRVYNLIGSFDCDNESLAKRPHIHSKSPGCILTYNSKRETCGSASVILLMRCRRFLRLPLSPSDLG